MPLSKIHNTLTSDHILLDGTDSTGANANSRVLIDASASDTDEGIIMSYEAGADDASVALTPSSFTLDALNVSGTTTFESAVTAEDAFAIPNSGTIGSASDVDSISISDTGTVTMTQSLTVASGTYNPGIIIGDAAYKIFVSGGKLTVVNNSNGVELGTNASTWGSVSDERKKDIIENIEDGLTKVNSLRAVIGKYKTETDVRRSFLIAQDVKSVLPEAVDDSDSDNFSLRYTDVIPLLVASIKELKAKVETLETKVATLEGG